MPLVRVLMLGPPGSGKGTQCKLVSERYGIPHISTGDLFRAEVKSGTPLGQELDTIMRSGDLVPDKIGMMILKTRLEEADCITHGWLGDGWTREHANSLSLLHHSIVPDIVVQLSVPREILVRRLTGRLRDPDTGAIYHVDQGLPADLTVRGRLTQRADDCLEAVATRLDIAEAQSAAALAPLREVGVPIEEADGVGPVDVVFTRIAEACDRHLHARSGAG